MGVGAMADDRSDRVVQEAFMDAGEYTNTPRIVERLAPLAFPDRAA